MLAAIALHLVQAAEPDLPRRTGDLLQYLIAIGVATAIGLLWKFGGRLTAIETVLGDPELGIKAQIVSLRKSRHNDANSLQEHETRIDGHDRDIQRIDAVLIKEPHGQRHITPTGEPYDRRSP